MAVVQTAIRPKVGRIPIVVDASSVDSSDSVGQDLAYQIENDVATSGIFKAAAKEDGVGFTLSLISVQASSSETAAAWTLTQDGQEVDAGVVLAAADRVATMAEQVLAGVNAAVSRLPTAVPLIGETPDPAILMRALRQPAAITSQ
ncbi:MAG: hypothetical protein ACRD2E_06725 [Terriglobales bacterium]